MFIYVAFIKRGHERKGHDRVHWQAWHRGTKS